MKYYLVCGEASGDLHGSNLMKEIKKKDTQAEFRFWGGDLMREQGGQLVKHYKDVAVMGFVEIITSLRMILNNIQICKQDILSYQPDCVILIDYPGFNLRLIQFIKEKVGIKIFYYISPQLWAWKAGRVHKIKKYVDKMFVILPFEEKFYHKYNYQVDFVGHPLLDAIQGIPQSHEKEFRKKWNLSENKKIIALLPGSRKQEIKKILPIMLSAQYDFPDYEFVIAGAPSQEESLYFDLGEKKVSLVINDTYALLQNAYAALVTSGTATLETALFGVPEVVCYSGNAISYQIAKRVIGNRIKYISLVNLVMDQEVVTELIQKEFNRERVKQELMKILSDSHRRLIQEKYVLLKQKLGGSGASNRTAESIVSEIQKS